MLDIVQERAYPTPYANLSVLPTLLLSLAMQRYTPVTKNKIKDEYDYIVVGAGAGGSVVASRLSEIPCVTILNLEAGKVPPRQTDIPGIARYFIGTDIDWNYKTTPQKNTGAGLNNRQLQWPSGKTIGGSTIFNAMLNVRGSPINYDDWAKQGAVGWSYKDVKYYFKKLEDNPAQYAINPSYHGLNGPITDEIPRYKSEFGQAVLKAAGNLNYPIVDNNGPSQIGFANFTTTTKNGQRVSAAKAYLVPAENRTNLDIVAETLVTKVLIENGRAVGVEIERNGQIFKVKARREVILSAGTVNTAQLLLLSGIGPKDHLQDMNIPLVADLPVGRNFQDHCGVILPYTITDEQLPFNKKLADPQNIKKYINTRKGPLTSPEGVTNIAFLTNNPNAPPNVLPDYELYFLEATTAVAKYQANAIRQGFDMFYGPYENATSIWCVSQIVHPFSRGSVTLSSSDVHDPPFIDPNYFDVDQDLVDIVEGMKQCKKVLGQKSLQLLDTKPYDVTFPGCGQFLSNETAYLRCQAQSVTITLSHPVGTARMGNPNDSTTVVDPQLRVLGITGLRVVDASVMPSVPTGNTYIPTVMVAEKASDIIKQTIQCPT